MGFRGFEGLGGFGLVCNEPAIRVWLRCSRQLWSFEGSIGVGFDVHLQHIRLITPITHKVTIVILIFSLLSPPDPPSRTVLLQAFNDGDPRCSHS